MFSLDRRFKVGRRVTERERLFTDALGGDNALSAVLKARVATAAQLAVAAEIARDKFLKGDISITADDLVRLSNQAARAERALRIPEAPIRPSIDDGEDDLASYVQQGARASA